ncbi:TetR/AcrR family transcriptional regulator [Flammeovirga agarivorans]|uniref:TetR/AcrR family transcriptional regulator n=1 Tax=Flammeovirga agarivorans TaxID=2726742 RepID=A0A7X8XUP1_9BACT|nr:TetR/AcrR family transcriptional regulator [Flammeovirga agarivorans]NLR90439.1 TetR/AcrR family transcriptional regulator [Flammeovirga agarivorans]
MAGRPKIFNQEEVLDKTINLFWENGYEATGTTALLKEVNLNKGSLYHTFKSKKQLFLAGLNHMERKALQGFEEALTNSEQPIEVIRGLFLGIVDSSYDENCKGCILGNTLMEFTGKDDEAKDVAAGFLRELESLFEKTITQEQEKGVLTSTENASDLAKYLINFWNGINISRRIYTDKQELLQMINFHLKIIK